VLSAIARKTLDYVGKEIIRRKMKIIVVQGAAYDELYIVQKKFFDRYLFLPPGPRFIESEQSAAKRLIKLVAGREPLNQSFVIVRNNSTSSVDYVFWFAPTDWSALSREELKGYILFVPELLRLEHEYVRLAEACLTTKLCAVAVARRNSLLR